MTELMPSLGITVVFPLNRSWNVVIQNLESFEIYIIYSMGAAACSSSSKKKDVFSINNLPYKINIVSYIWNENGHNLFDYESETLSKKEIDLDFQARIVHVDKDILALTKNEFVKHQKEVFELKCDPKQVLIVPIEGKNESTIWRVVRPLSASDLPTIERYKLSINNIIKLGRVKLILKEYSLLDPVAPQTNKELCHSNSIDSNLPDSQYSCKICLSKLSTVDNPFISPCLCAGSMRYLHLKCLQNWININIKVKQQNGISLYYWRSLKCEVCKSTYKTEYRFQDYEYKLLDIPLPNGPFLMFEINHVDKNKEKGFYVVELKDKVQIKIGRTQDCDIKLHDISVSRHHATIFVQEQEFYIEDNCSKFGTLIQGTQTRNHQQHKTKELQVKRIAFQAGRIVVIVTVEKKSKSYVKYRVPTQYEVFKKLKLSTDDEMNSSVVQENQVEDEEILINDPQFLKDQELQKMKYANYLSGSICVPAQIPQQIQFN